MQNWNQKYDHDIDEQEKILEQLKSSRDDDLNKLYDYKERYNKEMEEKATREENVRSTRRHSVRTFQRVCMICVECSFSYGEMMHADPCAT